MYLPCIIPVLGGKTSARSLLMGGSQEGSEIDLNEEKITANNEAISKATALTADQKGLNFRL